MPTAMVLGGAGCVWNDAKRAQELFTPDLVIAVNDMITLWTGKLDLVASLHPEGFKQWFKDRRDLGLECKFTAWSQRDHAHGAGRVPIREVERVTEDWGGSSSMLAVKVVLVEYNCTRVVVCGAPLDAGAGHVKRKRRWEDAPNYQNAWIKRRKILQPFVRSMSGWSMHLLGGLPTAEWLAGA